MQNTNNTTIPEIEIIKRIPVITTILDVVCSSTDMGFAAVARVTDSRWIACAVKDNIQFGLLPGGELKLETTICNEIRQSHKEVVIDEVSSDKEFASHHTPAMYGFQSYISMPIFLKDGKFFGTLCAIDPNPAKLNNPKTIGMFKLFADLIAFHYQAEERLAETKSNLLEERTNTELREQFIAILGHDLRNPVGAISNSAQILQRMPLDDQGKQFVRIIRESSLRIKLLVDNILDFARGRLGGGITLNRNRNMSLHSTLHHVIDELQVRFPDSLIKVDMQLSVLPHLDDQRIAQLFSNLLGNALTHGDNRLPVFVTIQSDEKEFRLSVENSGKSIPAQAMNHLFKPFSRSTIQPGKEGLGLGLYIASEIAKAHDGVLEVESDAAKTVFTFRLPASLQDHPGIGSV